MPIATLFKKILGKTVLMIKKMDGGLYTLQTHNILKMKENSRTAGSMPSWEMAGSQQDRIAAELGAPGKTEPQTSALAYQVDAATQKPPEDEFSFFDLLDMVNPLQHIPVVGHVYRELTGDEIKPISQVVGGAVFGGPAGAAAGIANMIVEEETGTDMTGNAFALVTTGKMPTYRKSTDSPEQRLAAVLSPGPEANDLPVSLYAFTSKPAPIKRPSFKLND